MLIIQLLTCDQGCLVTKSMLMLVISMDINRRSQSHCQTAPATRKRHEMVILAHKQRKQSRLHCGETQRTGTKSVGYDCCLLSLSWRCEEGRTRNFTELPRIEATTNKSVGQC